MGKPQIVAKTRLTIVEHRRLRREAQQRQWSVMRYLRWLVRRYWEMVDGK